MRECKGEYIAVREMRKHIAWYMSGFPNAAQLRDRACRIESFEDMEKLLENI